MSAAHAHAPSDHPTAPSAAPSAAPAAANNAMHFKHGGVLGLTESIARLVKGVTYDAAMDTFAHPTDGAHPAPHADHHPAPHPTPTADGAHPAPHHAPAAGHDGHEDDDDDSISGSIIKGLSHMGHYGMAFPLLAQGLKWAKNKMFPEIHEIPTEDQHLGDQILHKLKKNKKNKTELDHHALEGFCKGLDIANLNRTFRMFTDPARFALAVDREAGREEIKKEIANILDLSGDVDLKEVEDQTNRLLHLLGHHVDSRVEPQRKHLVDIINNVKAWLTKDTLKDIYEPKAKEGNFKIDFEHFGDMLLEEVTPENRDRYLRSIKPSTFQATFKAKFPYLTNEGALKIALKKEPEREKVLAQLRQFTGVDYAMDYKALEEHIKALQERIGEEPADVDGPTPPTKVKGPLYHEYKAFEVALTLVKTTMKAEVLADLFEGKTEDASAKFEWTEEKYKNFGTTLLGTVNDKNREEALSKFDFVDFEREVGTLKDEDSIRDQFESDPGELKKDIYNLFNLSGIVTDQKLQARAQLLFAKLGLKESMVSSPDAATDSKQVKLGKFIFQAAAALIRSDLLSELFENAQWTDANNFANTFTEVTDRDITSYVKTYNSVEFRGHFHYLFELDELDRVITSGTPEDKNEAKEQVRTFSKQNTGDVSQGRLDLIVEAYETQMSKAASLKGTAGYDALERDIKVIKANFDKAGNRLNKLFKPEKGPEVKVVTPDRIGNILKTEIHKDSDVHAFLRGYKPGQVRDYFSILADKEALDEFLSGAGKNDLIELQKLLRAFTGMNIGRVTEKYLETMKKDFQKVFDGTGAEGSAAAVPAELKSKYEHFMGLVDEVLGVLKKGPLDKIFNLDEVGKVKINYEQLGAQIPNLELDQILPFLRELNISRLGQEYGILVSSGDFDGLSGKARKALKAKINGLFGLSAGATPSHAQLSAQVEDLLSTLLNNPAIKTDYQAQVNFNQLRTKFGAYLTALSDTVLGKIYASS